MPEGGDGVVVAPTQHLGRPLGLEGEGELKRDPGADRRQAGLARIEHEQM
jgi:hypothetical protein